MTSLRTRVVDAGARKLLPTMLWNSGELGLHYVTWEEASDAQRDSARDSFAAFLDAMLDVLAENADEWWLQAFQPERRDGKVTDGLIAVLREDRSP